MFSDYLICILYWNDLEWPERHNDLNVGTNGKPERSKNPAGPFVDPGPVGNLGNTYGTYWYVITARYSVGTRNNRLFNLVAQKVRIDRTQRAGWRLVWPPTVWPGRLTPGLAAYRLAWPPTAWPGRQPPGLAAYHLAWPPTAWPGRLPSLSLMDLGSQPCMLKSNIR
jgi:hypothetical protein